jgi:hypothetical protein
MAEQWLSIVDYARTFGISDMTIRRRIRTGRLQAYLRDGKYYIPIDSDPSTGEPIKQSSKPRLQQASPTMKSHPSAERTIPKVRVHEQRGDIQHDSFVEHRPVFQSPHRMAPNVQAVHVEQRQFHPQETKPPTVYSTQQFGQIPGHMAASIAAESEVSVEAQALLEYCNSSLATVKDIERHIEGRYVANLETAHEQIKGRDAEIAKLNQQIEDLQLLVQILERRRS